MSTPFSRKVQIRWADIDANQHLRHSAYYDYGAAVRMMFLSEMGLTTSKLKQFQIGPVLFREEAIFKREINFEDGITLDLALTKASSDYGRWSFRHNFIKDDGSLAAIVTVDGAWIDVVKRKLAAPDPFIQEIFNKAHRAEDFQSLPLRSKS
jgi:acyl-CoA thioester hydrolase